MGYTGIFAGLGNPGHQYEGTRHNCGFMATDILLKMAEDNGKIEQLNAKKFNALLWRVEFPELAGRWLVTMPQTFMNDSGRALGPLMSWYNLSAKQLVVAQDELDIPAGALRFKFGGGLAGHNGLASIAQHLGTPNFYRLRIGIGHPSQKGEVIHWVLAKPNAEDRQKIQTALPEAIEVFLIYAKDGKEAAAQFARDASRANLAE